MKTMIIMDEICVWCYTDREVIVRNINGKCDNCGGTTFDSKKELDLELYGETD